MTVRPVILLPRRSLNGLGCRPARATLVPAAKPVVASFCASMCRSSDSDGGRLDPMNVQTVRVTRDDSVPRIRNGVLGPPDASARQHLQLDSRQRSSTEVPM